MSFGAHQRRVASFFPPDSIEHHVALYHDHFEDGLGEVPDEVRAHVEVLTRMPTETYGEYIVRVATSGDEIARRVKIADASDNLARCRGAHGGRKNPYLERRYLTVLGALMARV